ncbi:hypothetical protein M758_5G174400 [Ceratodon purpureus]|nr:hypothetical protein M758_5G174400 [Ceratodon purpureus]
MVLLHFCPPFLVAVIIVENDSSEGAFSTQRRPVNSVAVCFFFFLARSLEVMDCSGGLCRGGHNPSYVYRLIAEDYSPEDYVLQ